ncbi:hypothetical protein SAMN05216413_0085 [Ruminococcaceae bacterium KH2T8]|nr:hypothetical protein SAMN05216413_0085 [Ruminococcaceae bacterium KH2T8]
MKNLKNAIATVLTAATIISGYSGLANAASNSPRPECTGDVGKEVSRIHDNYGHEIIVRRGDANSDGVINAIDATHILRYLNAKDAKKIKIPGFTHFYVQYGDPSHPENYALYEYLYGYYYSEMDVDHDGDVDQVDATRLLQYLLWRDF